MTRARSWLGRPMARQAEPSAGQSETVSVRLRSGRTQLKRQLEPKSRCSRSVTVLTDSAEAGAEARCALDDGRSWRRDHGIRVWHVAAGCCQGTLEGGPSSFVWEMGPGRLGD